ncbi:response regulator transcription factor [Fluviicola taffensis]|uniref:response regulator transcription factor n=1 Tax=Fluviicola taffensis TaxID=191579 RepID=UPI003137DCF7
MKKILIIEDDQQISSLVEKGLSEEGFETKIANNGLKGLDEFHFWKPDLIILDLMLPGLNGIQVCSKIREASQVPILMLTALGTPENVALGLDSGADDYLPKPFKFIELNARVRSLLRRVENQQSNPSTVFHFDDLVMDDDKKTVTRGGNQISLTSTEYRLLLLFVMNPRKVFSRIDILEDVWGVDFESGTNVVDVYVNYLRKKLLQFGGSKLIHTVIGMGYVMREEE